jgi:pimeloyl-ACP methyl ester carboxylesterase
MSRWVLLRGLAREAGHWGAFPDRLRAVFPGEEVLTPDLPGCGRRHHQAVPSTLGGLVDAVRAETGPFREPAWLLGLSLGGMVALDWATRFGGEVAGVVLVNSSAGGLSPPWRRLRPRALSSLLGAAATRDVQEREAKIFRLTSARPERATEAVSAWTALAAARPVGARSAGQLLLGAARYRPRLAPLPLPTLVVVGAGDRLCHPTCSGQLAAALHAALVVHPTAGHELPFDEPAWLLEQLSQWRATILPDRHVVTKG